MKPILVLALFGSAAGWAAEPVPLNLKTGEWEYTVTMQSPQMAAQMKGKQMPQLTPEQLAQIPAAQRAQIEAAMKSAGAVASGQPVVNKNCVKKEDLSNFNPPGVAKNCKMNVTNSTSSKFEAKFDCDESGNKMTGTVVAEALSSESMRFTVTASGAQNGQPMTMNVNGTGKWLSSTCTDAK